MWNSALLEKFNSCFSGGFCEYWQIVHFRRGTRHLAIILWSFEIFLIVLNFLTSQVLSRSVTRETIRIYQFFTNNQAPFHLWWKENLLNHQKVSKFSLINIFLVSHIFLLFNLPKGSWNKSTKFGKIGKYCQYHTQKCEITNVLFCTYTAFSLHT